YDREVERRLTRERRVDERHRDADRAKLVQIDVVVTVPRAGSSRPRRDQRDVVTLALLRGDEIDDDAAGAALEERRDVEDLHAACSRARRTNGTESRRPAQSAYTDA